MDKKKIIEAIKTWNEKQENKLHKYIFAEELTVKQRANVEERFGRGVNVEEWIAVYDDTLTRNGKKGFLFTESKIYGYALREPLVWDELEAIWQLSALYVAILSRDGSIREAKGATTPLSKIIPVMQDVLEMNPGDAVPVEAYEEFHCIYGRELRRRLKELFKRESIKHKELKFRDTLAEEVVQNAISHSKAEVSPEQILAVWLVVGMSGRSALLFTEDAIYSGYTFDGDKLHLDGLVRLDDYSDTHHCAIYENNFACKIVKMVPDKELEAFLGIVKEIVAIYKELREEIQKNDVQNNGVDTANGWDIFEEKLQNNEIETYKNALFVSSTFKDMHFERDIIHEKVQPALSTLAKKYGETLTFCDLRWGVNTEDLDSDEGAKKVLIVCLDEIERCDPYMLIMLGERYGWIPDGKIIKNALEGRRGFELKELETSVTALEIEFGALSKQTQLDRIFVYFREMETTPSEDYKSESKLHAQKLSALKARVKKLAPDRVKTYTLSWDENTHSMSGIEEFAQMVTEDIGKTMEGQWKAKEKLTSFETEISQHWLYAEQKAAQCHAREEILKEYLKYLEEGNHMLTLTGVSGCGKSTIMGALATILKYSNVEVLPLFSAYTEKTDTAIELIQHIVYYFENLLGQQHFADEKTDAKDEEWINRMYVLTTQYSKEKDVPVFILIDALDQLGADSIRDNLKFIPQDIDRMDSKVYMIMSCLADLELVGLPMKKSVPMLETEKKEAAILGILKKNRRELEWSVINEIEKKAASNSPLYMTLLIQRLLMMNKNDFKDIAAYGDGMSAITRHQLGIVADSGESISEICKEMIAMAAQRIGGEFVKTAIDYIICSRHGLRASDLEGLLKRKGIPWNRLEFSIFINYLRNIFVLRENGCYDFSHKIIREELAGMNVESLNTHKELADWFRGLSKDDSLREKELAYHLINARDSERFVNHVENMVHQNEDTKLLLKDTVAFCREDKGIWLSDVIRESDSFEFVRFFNTAIRTMFSSEEADLNIREDLLLTIVKKMETLLAETVTEEHQYQLSVAYSRLGKVYELKNNIKAIEFYEKSLALSEVVAKETTNLDRHVDVGIDYRMIANAHEKFDNDKTLQKSLFYCQKSIALLEQIIKESEDIRARIMLGWSYKRMGDFYSELENAKLAEENYDACRKLREAIVRIEPNEKNTIDLCNIYDIIAEKYKNKNCSEKALELYEKMIFYYERIVRENRTLSNMRSLAWAYSDAGYLYYLLKNEGSDKHALLYFEKSAPIFEESLRQKENMYMIWSLADNYRYSVNILRKFGGAENGMKCENLAKRALELYEYRAKKIDDISAYESWSLMVSTYYLVTDNINIQAECLEKDLELNEILYKRTRDKKFKKEISRIKQMMTILKLNKLV